MKNTTYKTEQETLKNEYLKLLASEVWQYDEKMISFISKEIASIIKTTEGYLISIEKPRMKKTFALVTL